MYLQSKTIRLRLIEVSDASFILKLRLDSRYNTFLSTVSNDLQAQIEWIRNYKIYEDAKEQFYFIIERLDGTPCGTVRIYDLREDSFCWGSWILNDEKTRYAAIESAILVYRFGFDVLGYEKSHFDVMKENQKVIAFHQKMGAEVIREDNNNIFFQISKTSVDETIKNLHDKLSMKIGDYKLGMNSVYIRKITAEYIVGFAALTEDNNPIHLDDEYAKGTRFKKRIAHGMLLASFFSKIFGTQFPGPGCIYLSQNLQFEKPVFIGDIVKAIVSLQEIDVARNRLAFTTQAFVDDLVVLEGSAEIYIPL